MHELIKDLEALLIKHKENLSEVKATGAILDAIDGAIYILECGDGQESTDLNEHGTWNKTQTGVK